MKSSKHVFLVIGHAFLRKISKSKKMLHKNFFHVTEADNTNHISLLQTKINYTLRTK